VVEVVCVSVEAVDPGTTFEVDGSDRTKRITFLPPVFEADCSDDAFLEAAVGFGVPAILDTPDCCLLILLCVVEGLGCPTVLEGVGRAETSLNAKASYGFIPAEDGIGLNCGTGDGWKDSVGPWEVDWRKACISTEGMDPG
jgi:hypothetical protein